MIVITGGIGCGKSVVCQLLKVMGHTVYDCDREAKRLMTSDSLLKAQLCDLFGDEAYLQNGELNKPYLSSKIFNNANLLAQMNALVHPAVARDIDKIKEERTLYVETAIHFESEFGRFISPEQVWCIASPLELRIERAMNRDHASREQILARINNQMSQEEKISCSDAVIWNDEEHSIIEQINFLINK